MTGKSRRGVLRAVTAAIAGITSLTLVSCGTSSQYEPDKGAERDSLSVSVNDVDGFSKGWEIDGYTGLVPTQGATVVTDKDGIYRIDPDSGEKVWSYKRNDAKLCHATEDDDDVVALFDSGRGCSDLVLLDGNTGEYKAQAQYGVTDGAEGRLVANRGNVAVVTPHFVRLVRGSDLVPVAEFGGKTDISYTTDQEVSNCDISDVAIGPDSFTVGSMCDGDSTYHVRVIDAKPEESTEGKVLMDVDTGSVDPVTTPMVSKSMFNFVVAGNDPSVYTWQLDKDHAEVSNRRLGVNQFAFGYQDIKGMGYVWRIGETVNVRYGSEDLSKSNELKGAIGNPVEVGDDLMVPMNGKVTFWNPNTGYQKAVDVDGLSGTYFNFDGNSVVSFHDGKVTGYKADEK